MSSEAEAGGGGGGKEQQCHLALAHIARIMYRAVPANGKISKDAQESVQECASEFISFITSEAIHRCKKDERKTINGDDIISAMAELGFDDYAEPLIIYLEKYREQKQI